MNSREGAGFGFLRPGVNGGEKMHRRGGAKMHQMG
jgi:hypothetical protein